MEKCEKAKEIQPCLDDPDGVGGTFITGSILYHLAPMNQPHDRDGFYYVTDEMAFRRCKECGEEKEYIESSKAIWLPRQDQLQEMLGGYEKAIDVLIKWSDWSDGGFDSKLYSDMRYWSWNMFTSMEQLWLAFVMVEKFSKLWNKEKKEWEFEKA